MATSAPAGAVPVTVIDGRGWGHGVGMSQDGAYWLAQAGRSHMQILSHFYPGTKIAKRGGTVRVPVFSGGFSVVLPQGGTIGGESVPAGFTVNVRAGSGSSPDLTSPPTESVVALGAVHMVALVRNQADGGDVVIAATAPTTSTEPVPPVAAPQSAPVEPTTTAPDAVAIVSTLPTEAAPIGGTPASPSNPFDTQPAVPTQDPAVRERALSDVAVPTGATVRIKAGGGGVVAAAGRRFRGTLEVSNRGGLRVVNELDMEDYLRGMGEIGRGLGYPPAALRAQAVAARTYGFRTMATQGEICASDRCQVYLGAQAEYPAMDDAVVATRGQVLTYRGKLAAAFFSASAGGESATVEEGFGGTNLPYLVATPYLTGDLREWSLKATAPELGRRLGYPGTARAVEVSRAGPSGRPLEVTITGSAGPRHLGGLAVKKALRLRSTLWTIRTEDDAVVPTLPADGGGAPDDAQSELLAEPVDTTADPSSPLLADTTSTVAPATSTITSTTLPAPITSVTTTLAPALLVATASSGGGLNTDMVLFAMTAFALALFGFALWRWFNRVDDQ